MTVRKITLKSITSLEPGQTIWDETIKGFGVRRQRKAAVYVLKYRDNNGHQKFITLGRHGSPWTPETARAEAKQYLAMIINRTGKSEAADRPAAAQTFTLSEFSEIYLKRYAALHKKPRSLAEDRRNLELHILPMLGAKKLTEINFADIVQFQSSRSECPANANRCLALISHLFTIAAKWAAIPPGTNPCRGVKRFRERMRERLFLNEEIVRLGRTLAEAEKSSHGAISLISGGREDWRAVHALQLLIYTGARLSEILSLEWGSISWDGGFARLPDSMTGGKSIPLPMPALEILNRISEWQGQKGKYVFPGKRKDTHFTGIQKPWQRIRKRAGLSDVRIHDLRHCYASTAVASGESLFLVGAVLGHRASSTTQRYAHLAMTPILDAANRTAGRLAALMNDGRHDRDQSKGSL